MRREFSGLLLVTDTHEVADSVNGARLVKKADGLMDGEDDNASGASSTRRGINPYPDPDPLHGAVPCIPAQRLPSSPTRNVLLEPAPVDIVQL